MRQCKARCRRVDGYPTKCPTQNPTGNGRACQAKAEGPLSWPEREKGNAQPQPTNPTHNARKVLRFMKASPLTSVMTESTSRFGFVQFAETWNGRMAMLGFVIGLATELLTGQGILSQIGLG